MHFLPILEGDLVKRLRSVEVYEEMEGFGSETEGKISANFRKIELAEVRD